MTAMAPQVPPPRRAADSETATFVTYFSISPRFCHHQEVGWGTTATASSATNRRASARSISASEIAPAFTSSTSVLYSVPHVGSVPAFTADTAAPPIVGANLWFK